tara:strand:+ start:233 stop:1504 length:1272 start_codon:yes stop_codon:yes gene_type:complete
MAEKEPCDCSDYEYDLKDCHKELEKTKEKLTSLREEKFLVCEQAKEQADEKIEMLKKQLTRWTIGGSVAATVVGKEAVEEITATIQGVEEAVNTIVPGAIPGVGSMIPGAGAGGGAGGPTPMTMPDGSVMMWDPSMGWMNGSAGFFGGAGGMGMGASNNVANQNPEKAKPQTEDEEEQEEEEKAKKKKKEDEEEEAEEEEEESEEDSEDEDSEDSEDDEDSEDSEDAEEEEADPAEMEEEEEAEQDEEDSTEDSEDQEQSEESSEEASDEQASNDAQQPEVVGLPSPELVVENGKIIDITGETLSEYIASLGEVSQAFNIPETPNLIENIPTILRAARQPQPPEVIVGDYETNDPQPPQILDEPEVIVVPEEDVYTPESPIQDPPYDPPPIILEANIIPEPGILLALFIPCIWQLITKRRRKK